MSDDIVADTITALAEFFQEDTSADPLSVPDIASRQQQAEEIVQGLAAAELHMTKQANDAELRFKLALTDALRDPQRVPVTEHGRKLTAAEREGVALEIPLVQQRWEQFKDAESQAKYVATYSKSMFARLSSLQSRLRASTEAGKAHGRYGEG